MFQSSPNLDVIQRHSFLNDLNVPEYLPSLCLTQSPTWCRTEYGELVSEDEWNSTRTKATVHRPSSRLPFSKYDANLARPKAETKKKDTVASLRHTEVAARPVLPIPPSHPTTFKIYDETTNNRHGERADHTSSTRSATSVSSSENLIARTKALTVDTSKKVMERKIAQPSPKPAAIPSPAVMPSPTASTPGQLGKNDESKFLHGQLERLETILGITEKRKGQYRPLTPSSMRNGSLPEHWVTRYVDYTSKYGLGFLLNDGCSGVFFNDSTKIALDNDSTSFQYVERRHSEPNELRRVDVLVGSHNLEQFPEKLNKKVTLLKHFRNYLLEQQKKDGEDPESIRTPPERANSNLVYVKKWLRTKHAILFWLSSDIVQVVFFDHTEVLLTNDESSIVYVDKLSRRQSYGFTDQVVGSFPELEKRVKYSRDILKQLLTGQRP